jgi:hypothetical protein
MKLKTLIITAIFLATSTIVHAGDIPFENCDRPYPDTYCNDKYRDAITYLSDNEIIQGYADGTFKPDQTLNRAEMLKIIAEGSALYYEQDSRQLDAYASESCFDDVPANQWFTKYVCYAKAEGWVAGYSDNTFRPSQTVNFVEGLKMTLKGFQIDYNEDASPWYRNLIDTASASNSIPFSITEFDQQLTRAEMSDLITRVIKASNGELENYLGDRAEKVVTYATIEQGFNLSHPPIVLQAKYPQSFQEDLEDFETIIDIWVSGSWPYKLSDNIVESYQGRLDYLAEQEDIDQDDIERIQGKVDELAGQVVD